MDRNRSAQRSAVGARPSRPGAGPRLRIRPQRPGPTGVARLAARRRRRCPAVPPDRTATGSGDGGHPVARLSDHHGVRGVAGSGPGGGGAPRGARDAYGLEDYQQRRISSFLDPEQDPQGAGYQQRQARITVGSGGLAGRGFLQGTQNQYNFLPVAHNDFIFSVLAEELGFVGVSIALALYLFVILRSLGAAWVARDSTGTYLVAGIVAGFTFQVIYNITMSAGLAPVKGLTLPLMSFGGSSIIATLMGFGLILNVRMRRFRN